MECRKVGVVFGLPGLDDHRGPLVVQLKFVAVTGARRGVASAGGFDRAVGVVQLGEEPPPVLDAVSPGGRGKEDPCCIPVLVGILVALNHHAVRAGYPTEVGKTLVEIRRSALAEHHDPVINPGSKHHTHGAVLVEQGDIIFVHVHRKGSHGVVGRHPGVAAQV